MTTKPDPAALTPELLPCPFCGEAGGILDSLRSEGEVIGCSGSCNIETDRETWNRRPKPTRESLIAALAELELGLMVCEWKPIETLPMITDGEPFLVVNSNLYYGCATTVIDLGPERIGAAIYETAESNIEVCSGVTHWASGLRPPSQPAKE